jgi:hypothetical protein
LRGFCTTFQIKGHSKDAKVHPNLFKTFVTEPFAGHIELHLSKDGFRFDGPFLSMHDPPGRKAGVPLLSVYIEPADGLLLLSGSLWLRYINILEDNHHNCLPDSDLLSNQSHVLLSMFSPRSNASAVPWGRSGNLPGDYNKRQFDLRNSFQGSHINDVEIEGGFFGRKL